MGHRLASAFALSALGGCSLIYNPNDLPTVAKDGPVDGAPDASPDAMIDAPIADAMPLDLKVTDVQPPLINEGQGKGGSPQQYLFISGHNFLDGATVVVSATDAAAHPEAVIHVGTPIIAADRNSIAVPITADVMPTEDGGDDIMLTVRVNQSPAFPTVFDDMSRIALHPLPQYTAMGVQTTAPSAPLYSQITIGADIKFQGTAPIILRSVSDISITGAVEVSAPNTYNPGTANTVAGPNGFAGGSVTTGAGQAGAGPTGGAGAPGAAATLTTGATGGGGGGFGTAGTGSTGGGAGGGMTGDATITDLTKNRGGGGGSGGGSGLGGSGGNGGGAGGVLELTAGGNLSITNGINAKGANGATGAGSGGGGGGSGGTVVLRAGGTFAPGTVDISGGAGMTTGGNGGDGRLRVDTQGTKPANASRGFLIQTPSATIIQITAADQKVSVKVFGPDGSDFTVYRTLLGPSGGTEQSDGHVSGGQLSPLVAVPVGIGLNVLCATKAGQVIDTLKESQNCTTVVGVPAAP